MKILIVYATKGGASREAAEMLASRIGSRASVSVFDINDRPPSPSEFDVAVIGGSIRMGRLNKKLKQYIREHTEKLSSMPCAVFICCGISKDFDDYKRCKGLLFKQCKIGIANVDDAHFEDVFKEATCKIETFGFSEKADLRANDVKLVSSPGHLGVAYKVSGLLNFEVEIDIPGTFSVYNSLTAIAVCRHFDVPVTKITEALKTAKVKGRIEMVKVSDDFTLMIDYAHNAMSLESLLTTLKEYNPKRLVCLFGCGGNRAKARRFEMGEVSGNLADLTIITSDNPRFEEPQDIINDIKTGISKTNGNYVEIIDRKEAIRYAIDEAKVGDVIVLAGKGHEDYQEIKGVKYDMDERVLIAEVVKESTRENLIR